MIKIVVVALGGAIGAVARYGLTGLIHRVWNGSFPLGTLTVNILGCLVIGILFSLIEDRSQIGPTARLFLTVGILGGFTTFSSFGYETMELLHDGQMGPALLNVAGNVVLGLGAVWAGILLARLTFA